MKNIIGGARIIYILLGIFVFLGLFSPDLNYAQEDTRYISMDFQDAPLKDVLKIFSQQAGLNFVAAKDIENKQVTLYLEKISVQDAMDSILGANNLTYEQKPGSSVFIVKESSMAKIKMITKVYSLNYATISKTSTQSSSSTSTPGAYQSSSDSDDSESDIKNIIENLLAKNSSGNIFGSVVVDQRTNSLIITSIPEDFPLIESTLAKLDARTPQVMIEAEIVEVKTTAIKKLGLDWGGTSSGTFFTFTGPSRDTGFPFVRESAPFDRSLLGGSIADSRGRTVAASDTGTKFGNLTLGEFQIVLKALEKENKARYLAKPKIMVINNETAEIKIASDTVVGTTSTSQATTGTVTTTAERMETGVILRVTPTINKDNYITMTLEPEVSRVEAANITGYYDPQRRSAKTTVMMKDTQTIAIGGLLKTETTDNDRAVPGISKIPILGNLFKSKDFQGVETEIIIFVTCHIVNPESENIRKEEIVLSQEAKADASETEASAVGTDRDQEIAKTVRRLRKKKEIE
ncbi:MAG: hypothetical protein JW946_00300 [Candidatus Omnitrophica bacterium]|nr:hypothetical protein [Candidatus Omnitrophota bacterium]